MPWLSNCCIAAVLRLRGHSHAWFVARIFTRASPIRFARYSAPNLDEILRRIGISFASPRSEMKLRSGMAFSESSGSAIRIYYGWWIVVAAFLNLFFVVGILFYGFP